MVPVCSHNRVDQRKFWRLKQILLKGQDLREQDIPPVAISIKMAKRTSSIIRLVGFQGVDVYDDYSAVVVQ